MRVNGFNGEFFRKYEKGFDFMFVFCESRICIRNTNNRVTANHKKLVGSPLNKITTSQADSVCGDSEYVETLTLLYVLRRARRRSG